MNALAAAFKDMPLLRDPYPGEASYFQQNPHVAGMMTEDGRVILNPHSNLSEQEKRAVYRNEEARLFMRDIDFDFDLTPEQQAGLKGTPYEADQRNARRTIIARILSGDPSARNATEAQRQAARMIAERMRGGANALVGAAAPKATAGQSGAGGGYGGRNALLGLAERMRP